MELIFSKPYISEMILYCPPNLDFSKAAGSEGGRAGTITATHFSPSGK